MTVAGELQPAQQPVNLRERLVATLGARHGQDALQCDLLGIELVQHFQGGGQAQTGGDPLAVVMRLAAGELESMAGLMNQALPETDACMQQVAPGIIARRMIDLRELAQQGKGLGMSMVLEPVLDGPHEGRGRLW